MTDSVWEAAKIVGALGIGSALTAVVGLVRKPSSKAENTTAQAVLVKAAQEAAASAVQSTHHEIARLERQAKADRSRYRRDLDDAVKRIRALENDNELCRNDNADLRQQLMSLEEILRRANFPIPARDLPGSFVFIEGGRTTVMKPGPKAKRRARPKPTKEEPEE